MPLTSAILNLNVDINPDDIVVVEVNELIGAGGRPGTVIRSITAVDGVRTIVGQDLGHGSAAMRRDADFDQKIIFDQANQATGATFSITATLQATGAPVVVFDNTGAAVANYTMATELLEVVVAVI